MPIKKSNKGFNIPSNSCSLLWNELPIEIKRSRNIISFKNNLKSYLLTKMRDGG